LAIVEILYPRQWPTWRAEVSQDPGRYPPERWNLLKHCNLMLVQISLVLFGPYHTFIAMVTKEGVRSELADDERLVQTRLPCQAVSLLGQTVVPANIFITAKHIEIFSQRIVNNLSVWIGITALVGGGQQARRIEGTGVVD